MEYRPVVPTGVVAGLQDYHAAIPDLSPPRSQGSSTGGASSIGDYAPRMYTPPTPPTPHEDEKVKFHSRFIISHSHPHPPFFCPKDHFYSSFAPPKKSDNSFAPEDFFFTYFQSFYVNCVDFTTLQFLSSKND